MSHYKKIESQFKNGESLIKALADLDVNFQRAADLKENGVKLSTNWSGMGGKSEAVTIAIQKADARACGLGGLDGVGFRWNGQGYDLVADYYDAANSRIAARMGELKQRYSLHETKRQARMKGYTVQEKQEADGTIRLILSRR